MVPGVAGEIGSGSCVASGELLSDFRTVEETHLNQPCWPLNKDILAIYIGDSYGNYLDMFGAKKRMNFGNIFQQIFVP